MRNPLRRYYGRGHLHFITFSCYQRRPFLGSKRARDCFVAVLDEIRERYEFRLAGYVVMPEHVHVLISEPVYSNVPLVIQALKQDVSRELRVARGEETLGESALTPGDSPAGMGHFWQRRFYDFNVWSSGKAEGKLDYMHFNPVKRKLVQHPRDWPWSSWSYYERGEPGLIQIDPFGEKANSDGSLFLRKR